MVPPMAMGLGISSSRQRGGVLCPIGKGTCLPAGHTSLSIPLFSPKQAHKNQVMAGKKEAVKVAPHKAQRALGVAKNNEINLKK